MGSLHLQPKSASFTQLRFEPDESSHSFHALFHNGKADARAFIILIHTLEDAKDVLVSVFIDP